MFYRAAEGVYRFSELDRFPWLEHQFGTRHSAPHGAAPENLATVKQVHSADVVVAHGRSGVLGSGDALIEEHPGNLVGIKTADCLPILLVDIEMQAVAAIHAGWRGAAQNIVAKTMRRMLEESWAHPTLIHAAIGPGIGPCCFEVGEEVAAQFSGYPGAVLPRHPRPHLDLSRVIRCQLLEARVPASQIYDSGECTVCRADDFYSFRREGAAAGRMLSLIGLRRNT